MAHDEIGNVTVVTEICHAPVALITNNVRRLKKSDLKVRY